ncbi:MAG: hypothetical protein V4638_09680 [Bacteroidota bacterium]
MRGIGMILIVATLCACQKAKVNKTAQVLTSQSWIIEEIVVNGEDVTSKGYQEYTFTFQEEISEVHAVIASLSTDISGNWEVLVNDKKATLILKVENPLGTLTENWLIEKVSKKQVVLSAKNNKKMTFKAID